LLHSATPDMQPRFLKPLFLSVYMLLHMAGHTQIPLNITDSLYKIAAGTTVSKHFAQLYYYAALQTDNHAAAQHPAAGQFVNAFKNKFAVYFLQAAQQEQQPQLQTFSWQRYYSPVRLNALQYYIVGMNAHINGDMWQALVQAHPYDSIKKYRRLLTAFQQPLNALFDSTYTACRQFKKFNRFHRFTLGLDKWYGKKILLHWRKKQLRLALLYYSDTAAFKRRLAKTHRSMKRLDAFVIKWLG
jgi:Family of unknown function (DUF5995)